MSFYTWIKINKKKIESERTEVREVREVRTESNFLKSKRLPPNPSLTYSNIVSNNDSEKEPFKDLFEKIAKEIGQA